MRLGYACFVAFCLHSQSVLANDLQASFKTKLGGTYMTAENAGGGSITANRTLAQDWETFYLIDKNAGLLESGDLISLKTLSGFFIQAPPDAENFAVNAASRNQLEWETFRIVKSRGSGRIQNNDLVGFQAISSGRWLSALQGGGELVNASGPALGTWEEFTINLRDADSWRLVWSDEFNGNRIDLSKWTYEVQGPGWVNHELQNYTNQRWENARVENGQLIIEGRRDHFAGYEYSSARLKTQGKASWTYGRIEARIQVPGGLGTWPAFWMMPDNQSRGWPACGEIDIMEHVGYNRDQIHATTHSKNFNWQRPEQKTGQTYLAGASSGFHVYAAEWYPNRIDFFVDGRHYFTSANDYTGDDSWPFNKNFHIIINLAIGGDWGGAKGVDPNVWPQQMLVDYVRVYQK